MKDAAELRNTIGMLRIGDKVEIGLLRDGKPRKVTALIAERSETETANAADISTRAGGRGSRAMRRTAAAYWCDRCRMAARRRRRACARTT